MNENSVEPNDPTFGEDSATNGVDPVDAAFTGGEGDLREESVAAAGAKDDVARERDKYLELARRTQAEFENYQKRVRRDWENERKYAALPVLTDLLPVLDNLERALQSPPSEPTAEKFVEGIRLLHKQWMDAMAKHGVAPVGVVGEPFDPNRHEAVMQQPSADYPPMTVLSVYRTGYVLHDRVLRPAQVIVSSAP